MAKGSRYPAEKRAFRDPETGVRVQRLTSCLCHSNHLYFTHWPYYAGGRKMLFHSDRGNAYNLFGIELESGEIHQLTGFEPASEGVSPFRACVNPARDEAYFWVGRTLWAIDLTDLTERPMWEYGKGAHGGMPNCSSDGRFVNFAISPDMSDKLPVNLLHRHVEPEAYLAARPHCQIVRVPTRGGEAEVVWEEDSWIGHINTSPNIPNILTFCHEGPWPMVEQRMWGLDTDAGRVWRIRPETEGIVIGHEYWFADGSRVGYHGRTKDHAPLWGHADPSGGDYKEYPVQRPSMHFHSLGTELLVSDGSAKDPYLRLWRWNGEGYDGAVLCKHLCSFHTQRLHVHPAMTPDGKGIAFTSDMHGYGNVYFVEIPDFESLPPVETR